MKEQSLRDLFHFVVEAVPQKQELSTIPADTPVLDALNLMKKERFSQIPVMAGEEVLGVFSYRSFAKNLIELPDKTKNPLSLPVEEFTEDLRFASVRDELVALIDEFDLKDAMLVGTVDNLQGIVTTSDALRYFHSVASPYVMLKEIELAIRLQISCCVTQDELCQCIEKSLAKYYRDNGKKPPAKLEEMSFMDYVSLLRFQGTWGRFNLGFGQSQDIAYAMIKDLPELRNAVFHFRRDLSAEEYEQLRKCRDWLLKKVRKTEATKKGNRNA